MMDQSDLPDWAKGVALAVIASIIGGGSKLAIRKSFLMEQEWKAQRLQGGEDGKGLGEEGDSSRPCDIAAPPLQNESFFVRFMAIVRSCRSERRLWQSFFLRQLALGGVAIVNPVCCILSMKFAPLSLLAPFAGLNLVWIVLFSEQLVGEKPRSTQIVAAGLMIIGQVVVAVFGDHSSDEQETISDVEESYLYPPFLFYFGMLAIWLALMTYWIRSPPSPALERFAWGVAGGSIVGPQNFMKDGLTILEAMNPQDYPVFPWCPWYLPLMFAAAVVLYIAGIALMTRCMKKYDVIFSSSMYIGSMVISSSIMTSTHYATFEKLIAVSRWNCILYPAGLLILFGGLWMLIHDNEHQLECTKITTPKKQKQVETSELEAPLIQSDGSPILKRRPITFDL